MTVILKRLLLIVGFLCGVLIVLDSFEDVPLIVPTRTCPTAELSAAEGEQLTKEALKIVFNDQDPERYRTSDLQEGMPMLRKAALSGNLEAQESYAGSS